MYQDTIRQFIERQLGQDGLLDTAIKGVRLFRVTTPIRCAPTVYEPCLVAIVSGTKEAIIDNRHYVYDNSQYLCCPISMPVEAGTPLASPESPLIGVYISLDTRLLTELALDTERVGGPVSKPQSNNLPQSLTLAEWDNEFGDALYRLLGLTNNTVDAEVLGEGRLRELFYTVLKGKAGESVRRAFGVGNEIARVIEQISERLDQPITIEEMAEQARMSRAVFHRKFKQATRLSPIQFVKSMRLNAAAMQMAEGITVSQAALAVGYTSVSQFSREFKRLFNCSPKQWQQNRSSSLNMMN